MCAERYTKQGLIWPLFSTGLFFLLFNGVLTLLFGYFEKKMDYFKAEEDADMAVLTVEGIQKSFSGVDVLRDISFSLEKGEALAIIGSSGSGKTTLLRCLNFLETPDKGVIRVGDQVIFDAEDPAPVRSRRSASSGCTSAGVPVLQLVPPVYGAGNVTLAGRLLAKERRTSSPARPPFIGKSKRTARRCWIAWAFRPS